MTLEEKWMSVDVNGKYQVSSLGKVKSLCRKKEAVLTPVKNHQGYYQLVLRLDNVSKLCRVNRLVAQAFLPNDENKPQVNHINGIKTDNRVENLEWATASENIRHAFANKLMRGRRGEESHFSKLKNKDIEKVKVMLDKGFSQKVVAEHFNITQSGISRIKNRRTIWA